MGHGLDYILRFVGHRHDQGVATEKRILEMIRKDAGLGGSAGRIGFSRSNPAAGTRLYKVLLAVDSGYRVHPDNKAKSDDE